MPPLTPGTRRLLDQVNLVSSRCGWMGCLFVSGRGGQPERFIEFSGLK